MVAPWDSELKCSIFQFSIYLMHTDSVSDGINFNCFLETFFVWLWQDDLTFACYEVYLLARQQLL